MLCKRKTKLKTKNYLNTKYAGEKKKIYFFFHQQNKWMGEENSTRARKNTNKIVPKIKQQVKLNIIKMIRKKRKGTTGKVSDFLKSMWVQKKRIPQISIGGGVRRAVLLSNKNRVRTTRPPPAPGGHERKCSRRLKNEKDGNRKHQKKKARKAR